MSRKSERAQLLRMSNHTKGPWKYSVNVGPTRALIVEPDGATICELRINRHDSHFEANARRIVACVNALEGLSLDEIEDKKFVMTLRATMTTRPATAPQGETR